MKAWLVQGWYDEYWIPFHGETRGKALRMAKLCWPDDTFDWTGMRIKRFPELDDMPFTGENTAHFFTGDDGETLSPDEWYNACRCELCKAEN